jgi:hypothetical protein
MLFFVPKMVMVMLGGFPAATRQSFCCRNRSTTNGVADCASGFNFVGTGVGCIVAGHSLFEFICRSLTSRCRPALFTFLVSSHGGSLLGSFASFLDEFLGSWRFSISFRDSPSARLAFAVKTAPKRWLLMKIRSWLSFFTGATGQYNVLSHDVNLQNRFAYGQGRAGS